MISICTFCAALIILVMLTKGQPHVSLSSIVEDAGHRKENIVVTDTGPNYEHVISSMNAGSNEGTAYFVQQRNDLSNQLNEQKKLYGQLSCEMRNRKNKVSGLTGKLNLVSDNGGWCEQISGSDSKLHMTDYGFAKAVSQFLKGKHVVSFGDGPGEYKKALDSYKEVASYMAYDGAPFCEKATGGKVNFLDLSSPQFGLKAFDWVISVEVGEHIPAKYEDIYLDNLVRHAKDGIILSWAVPGQEGTSHVNLRTLDHVVQQMWKRGFNIDREGGEHLRSASKFSWLHKNVHIYRRVDQASFSPEDV